MCLCRESKIIAGLCLADLATTIFLVRSHGAAEANPVMRFYLEHGLLAFIGVKCLLFLPALFLAEWYRHRNPRLITGTLRLVIFLYVGLYSVGVYRLNRVPVRPGLAPDTGQWIASPPDSPEARAAFTPLSMSGVR